MMRNIPELKTKYFLLIVMLTLMLGLQNANSQTPGLIIKPALSPGNAVLDPDGDGYVSQKTNGIQLGFTIPPDNDVTQSEIPYVAIIRPDPLNDLLRGPVGAFCEIVGVDAAGNNAILTYNDGTNFYVRFRLGGYAPNSKSYSLLIDTDGKFGFTGPNADPDAVNGNPGFEAEITLETNFNVKAFNVDGPYALAPNLVTSASYDTNCQKSVAVSTAGSDPDYFYDFYLPLSSISSLFSSSTPLRIVAVTVMNPNGAIGNNAISDVGGVTTGSNLDAIYAGLIDSQTPTVPGTEVLDRSACPLINSVAFGNTTISGTSTEASGTSITVYVYDSDGTSNPRSATTTTSGSTWTIDVSSLIPSVTLAYGQIVKATATASGKGTSYDNCDIETVADICATAPLNKTYVPDDNNTKGICANAGAGIAGATIRVYDSSGTEIIPVGGGTYTVAADGSFQWKCNSSNSNCNSGAGCMTAGQTYFVTQTINGCQSQSIPFYSGSSCTISATPAITTSTITTTTTSLSGTGVTSATVYIYSGTNQIATGTVAAGNWTITIPVQPVCSSITAKQVEAGKCLSAASTAVTVTRTAIAPSINSAAGCSVSIPTSISGFSTEIGATIQLYKSTDLVNAIGTATVAAGGIWTVSTISPALASENIIKAKVATGGCLTVSDYSNQVTITTQANISSYTIGITTPTEGQLAVSGTISGLSGSEVLKLYVDEAYVGQTSTFTSGNWTVSGLTAFDLAAGSKVQVTITTTGCESELSSTYATVQCSAPANKTISASTTTYCANSYGTITVQNSQSGVLYTPVASDGTTVFGYGAMGTGSNLNLTTYQLTTNPTVVKVKASKFPFGSCVTLMSGTGVTYTVNPLPAAPTGSSPQIFCASETTTLANLVVTAPSGSTVKWYAASSGGSSILSSTTLVNGTTYYAESENSTTLCLSSSRTAILVQTGTPPAPTANASQTFCAGSTVANLAATLSGPGTVNWYSAASGGSALSTGLSLATGNYYAETSQNTCVSSSRTAVAVTVVAVPTPTFVSGPTTVCLGSTGNVYTTESGKSNYDWSVSVGGSITSGGGSGDNSVTVTWNSPGSQTVSVNYSNGTCSAASATVANVSVNSVTGGTIGSDQTITSGGDPAAFTETTASTGSGTLSYQWQSSTTSSSSGFSDIGGEISTTYDVPSGLVTTSYYKRITTSTLYGVPCVAESNVVTVIVGVCTDPSISVQPTSPSAVCAGTGTPTMSVTASGTGLNYQWYVDGSTPLTNTAPYNGTTSATLTITNPSYSLNGKQYKVIVTGACGSPVTSNTVTLTVNPVPAITAITSTICSDVGFTVSPTDGTNGVVPSGTTYSWSAPSVTGGLTGGASGTAAASITGTLTNPTSSAQTATYTVTPTAGSCTGSTFTVTVTVNAKPTASVSGTASICGGSSTNLTITLTGTSPWNFTYTDGTSPVTVNSQATSPYTVSVSPSSTKTYSVTAVSDANCSGTSFGSSATITVTPLPSATISYGATTYCNNDNTSYSVTRTGTAGGTYSASPAGLSSLNVTTGSFNPKNISTGTYTITYTMVSGGGCPDQTATTSITITDAPVTTFSYTATPYCQNASNPSPTYSGGGQAGTFTASPAGLVFVSTATGQVNLASSTAGTYTVTNSIICGQPTGPVTSTSSITITALPAATISYSGTPFCKSVSSGQSVTLTGTSGGTYSASPAGLTIDTNTGAITPSTSTAGTYTVTYTMAATGGCSVQTATTSVTINPLSVGGTTAAASTAICTGSSTTITVSDYTGTIQWQQSADGSTGWANVSGGSGGTTATYTTPNLITTTYYRAVVTSGVCSSSNSTSASVTVAAQPIAPAITKSPSDASVCSGQTLTVTITAGSGGAGTTADEYRYSTDNGSNWSAWSSSVPSFAAVTGTNLIESRRTASGTGCTTSSSNQVSWTVVAQPTAPSLLAKTPNLAIFCPGVGASATFNAGSGGTGCTDDYIVIIDGGAPSVYTPGSTVGTTATSSIDIQGRRANCTGGSGCTGTSYVSLASWVIDNVAPTITCPSNITQNVDIGTCSAYVTWTLPIVTDNCLGTPTVVRTNTPGITFDDATHGTVAVGTTTITYTATDASGNSQSCSFDITVTDNILPTITCPSGQTVFCVANAPIYSTLAEFTTAGGSADDNCSLNTSSLTHSDVYSAPTLTRTYQIADAAGNTSTCDQVFTISQPAVTIGSLGLNNTCIGGALDITSNSTGLNYQWQVSSDNGSSWTTTGTNSESYNGTLANQGDQYRLRVSETNDFNVGCVSTSNVLTFKENIPPVFTSLKPTNQTVCIPNGATSGAVYDISLDNSKVTDVCTAFADLSIAYNITGTTTLSGNTNLPDGTVFNLGISTVEYTVTDLSGNSETHSFTVTVSEAPTLTDISTDGIPATDGSGYKPYQSSTHTYTVDGGTANLDFTYTWSVLDNANTVLSPGSTDTYTINTANPAAVIINWGASIPLSANNYKVRVRKTSNTNTCFIEKELAVTVLENLFNATVVDLGDQCQSGEAGTTTIVEWITNKTGGANNWRFDYEISDGVSVVASGLEVPVSGNTKSIFFNVSNQAGSDKTYTFTITNVFDEFDTPETDFTDNDDTVTLWGVPNTSEISTD